MVPLVAARFSFEQQQVAFSLTITNVVTCAPADGFVERCASNDKQHSDKTSGFYNPKHRLMRGAPMIRIGTIAIKATSE